MPSYYGHSRKDSWFAVQDAVNILLQQYLVDLIDSGQHSLLPVYACHLRAEERREVSLNPPFVLARVRNPQ